MLFDIIYICISLLIQLDQTPLSGFIYQNLKGNLHLNKHDNIRMLKAGSQSTYLGHPMYIFRSCAVEV